MILVLAKILTAIVALMHIYFLWLERFAWSTKAKKVFKNFPSDLFEPTKSMAANQGLYNGFLASGLLFSLWHESNSVSVFFLICVSIAGIYGAYSTKQIKLFYIQSVPAIITLLLLISNNF